ncbi:MAG: DUF3006 domain-containing protein [Oscillospiraceae bacterium]|nr:DUF3006 domain-containing protein [Oscillospiraceae bacterium]MDD7430088.1 DUF3006 domain-containing protein [Oscillospiraceae bacterium]MDY2847045.1 DUF3006 domain-containing protein [Oscillospiraceae bacterium]
MLCVDRIEGRYAVCYEDKKKTDIPLSDIIGNVREGDILIKSGSRYSIDRKAAESRKQEMLRKQNSLWSEDSD